MPGKRTGRAVSGGVGKAPIAADRAKQRRAKYADDPEYANRIREDSRTRYQETHPRTSRSAPSGLVTRGEQREVVCDNIEHPVTRETFTIPEAAEALGKSLATIRRWIAADKIPGPFFQTTRGYPVYTHGELQVIHQHITRHEDAFSYLGTQHTHVIEQLHQAVFAYRAEFI